MRKEGKERPWGTPIGGGHDDDHDDDDHGDDDHDYRAEKDDLGCRLSLAVSIWETRV